MASNGYKSPPAPDTQGRESVSSRTIHLNDLADKSLLGRAVDSTSASL